MRVAVIGAGAIGSAVAASLVDAARDVVLVAREQRLAELVSAPIRLESNGRQLLVRVPVSSSRRLAESRIDLAICCVKTPALESTLSEIAGALAANAAVLTLQNGVEAHEQAARALTRARIVAGRMHGFFEMHDGVARHVGVPASIMVGSPKGDTSAEDMVIDAFSASGISAAVSPDIILTLWEKFLLAASLGSVGAAMGIPAGQVLAMAGGSKLLRDAMAEIVALARHRGVNLGMEHVSAAFEFIGTFPEEATTSLQRDLAAGRASEFDALSAAVPRLAAASDFPVEVFPRLLRLIAANSVT